MTCIAGIARNGKVWIGGDSAGIAGWSLTVRKDPKVFHVGEFLIGFTSSFRMGQLLQYSFEPPAIPNGIDLSRYMVTLFVDALRAALKLGGFAKTENNVESGGTFLVGIRGRLFEIDSDYQVGEAEDQIAAVGCGAQVALGALHVSKGLFDPDFSIRSALEAAERFSAGVRAPFRIEVIP